MIEVRPAVEGLRGPRRKPRPERSERGAAAVEFALVLTPLLLVVFGVVAYGLVFSAQLSMNTAARDAARAGVVQPLNGTALTCQAIATQARSASATIGLDSSRISVTVTNPAATGSPTCTVATNGTATGSVSTKMCTGAASGSTLLVTVRYPSVSVPVPIVPIPSSLTSTGSFACEYS